VETLYEILVSAATGVFGVGVAWGTLNSRLAAITKRQTNHEEAIQDHERKLSSLRQEVFDRFERHTENIHKREIEEERIKARLGAMEVDVNERAINADKLENKFDKATKWQNEMLMTIQRSIGRASKDSREFPAVDPRSEPKSDPPMPSMRRRLPSITDK
jgi:hypothetical protein